MVVDRRIYLNGGNDAEPRFRIYGFPKSGCGSKAPHGHIVL